MNMVTKRFKPGDRVKFLDETGGGTVKYIDESGTVYIESEDGFEIPAHVKHLIHAGGFEQPENQIPAESKVIEQMQITSDSKQEVQVNYPDIPVNVTNSAPANILLGFIPVGKGPVFSNHIECYLINDSKFLIHYLLGTFSQGNHGYLASGILEPDTKYCFATYDQSSISKIAAFHLQVLFVSGGKYLKKAPWDEMIDLRLVNFGKDSYYHENDYFEKTAVLFNPSGPLPVEATASIKDGDEPTTKAGTSLVQKQEGTKRKSDTYEVDLHIENLVDNEKELTPAELLNIQLNHFHHAMDEAIVKKMRRIIIIHGVGQGTLKLQIRKELQEKYPEYAFQDASFKEYGFGATMVHLHTIKKQ